MRVSGAVFAAVMVMLAAGATIATAGIGDLVTSADNGVRGNASQAPIGNLSATPRAPEQDAGGGDILGERDVGGEDAPADGTQPLDNADVAGAGGAGGDVGGSGAGTLPFTGFLAIPVLLLGAAMLVGGVVLRRRAGAPASR